MVFSNPVEPRPVTPVNNQDLNSPGAPICQHYTDVQWHQSMPLPLSASNFLNQVHYPSLSSSHIINQQQRPHTLPSHFPQPQSASVLSRTFLLLSTATSSAASFPGIWPVSFRERHECGLSAGCRRYTRQKYLQVRHPRIRITRFPRIQPALDHGFQNFAGTCRYLRVIQYPLNLCKNI